MRKLKLLFAACTLFGAMTASAQVIIETDLTSQFNSLATTQWTGSSGQVGWAAPEVTTNSGLKVAAWERYNGSCDWTGDIMYSTVTGLPAGTYKIELYGAAAFTFGRGFGSTAFTGDFSVDNNTKYKENDHIDENTGVTLYATTSEGTVSQEIPIYYATNFNTSGIATATLNNVVVGSTGEIKIGLSKTSTSTNWHVVQLKGVTAMIDAEAAFAVYKEDAEGLYSSPMNATVLSELQTAANVDLSAAGSDEYKTAIETLAEKLAAAKASVSAYANAKAYLDEAESILAGTNVYSATAYATYYSEPKAKYEARTLTTEEGNALVKTSTGWHTANTIDDILLSVWTIGGEQAKDYDKSLYINTWSVEGVSDGSEFLTPFFEYWVEDAKSLGATNLVATMTGLKANTTYSFTIRARVRQTNNQTKIANGITMKVGDGDAVDISAGTIFKTGPFYIGNFSAVGETDTDGKLTATITVAENSNISWLSFYNCKYTEGEDLSAYIADYEFALSTAEDCRDNAAYAAVTGKERADLLSAITTYGSVDNTDKAALIAAKTALETASNTFVAAAPNYNSFAELNANVASTLGVALPTISETTVAADLPAVIEPIIVAEYTAAKAYAQDYTSKLGEWTNAPGTNKGESWDGSSDDTYYDEYNKAARAMTQTVILPPGDYALIAKGRGSVNGRLTLTVGTETVTFPHKSSTGRGIATDGTATFADDATYANSNNGRGWEYRVLTFTSDGVTPTELTFNWTTASSNWCGLDDIELLCNPVTITSAYLAGSFNGWSTTDLEMTQVGETNSYSCELDIDDLADVTFKPVINGNWMAFGQFTMDESNPAGWLEDAGDSDNHNIKLNNSTTGYKTYTVTATWTPSLDVTAGWTLKIEGKDERTKNTYTVNFVKGWSDWSTVYAYAWNDNGPVTAAWPGEEMTASTDTKYGFTVYTLSFNSYTAPTKVQFNVGNDSHKIDNLDFTDGMTYEGVTFEDFTVTDAGWATAKTTNNVTFTDVEGLKAYIATLSGTTVTLTEATTVPANTPIVLKGVSAKAAVVETADAVANNALTWYDEYKVNDDYAHIYALTIDKNDGKAKFARVENGVTFSNKAVIELIGATARESFDVVFAGETTGINAIVAEQNAEGIYNMNGQRVTAPTKGLYIVNGKKIILK
ncbi:MAG: starch-binding protein [Prevotella sp.]|nr:starch-binding protein [Prevotella sp.]